MAQRQTAALLQQQQLGWERLEQQHAAEVARLQQQLEEACAQARSAEAAVVHIRCDTCGVCPKWPTSKGTTVSMPVCCSLMCVQVNVCMHPVRKIPCGTGKASVLCCAVCVCLSAESYWQCTGASSPACCPAAASPPLSPSAPHPVLCSNTTALGLHPANLQVPRSTEACAAAQSTAPCFHLRSLPHMLLVTEAVRLPCRGWPPAGPTNSC